MNLKKHNIDLWLWAVGLVGLAYLLAFEALPRILGGMG